jgi:mono/diheme cytochrome c family protein
MNKFKHIIFALAVVGVLFTSSCQQPGGNKTGSEYVPDMAHSIAYEANVYGYYSLNTWEEASVVGRKEMSNPKLPVAGTVPRGYAGHFLAGDDAGRQAQMAAMNGEADGSIRIPKSGHVPYYFENSEEGRTRATDQLLDNPFPITADGLARGKELYNVFCGICHGEKGDGAGYLVRDPNPATGDAGGKYPAAPANMLLEEFVSASNGRYYHAIMYGKNVMGGYADKLSYEERWQVIHYIRLLQAKELKLDYSADANSLNPRFGVPGATLSQMAMQKSDRETQPAANE